MRIMPNVRTIYQQTILPLPKNEKLRLATIILQDLSSRIEKTTSALEVKNGGFKFCACSIAHL